MKTSTQIPSPAVQARPHTARRTVPARLKQLTHRAIAALALLAGLAVHVATVQAAAPTFTVLKNLDFSTGYKSQSRLTQGTDGAIYGTTDGAGAFGGTLFKLNPDGSGFTVLRYSDGGPTGRMIQGVGGALYGTTFSAGTFGFGTVFKLNLDGSDYTVLHSFDRIPDGSSPVAGLVQGADGALYGTTYGDGYGDYDTVFKVNPDGSGFTVLHAFSIPTESPNPKWIEGVNPSADLVLGTDGALYGTTPHGGSGVYNGTGTIFKLNPDGTGFTVVHRFNSDIIGGSTPYGGVIQGADGALYGTTSGRLTANNGTVFKLNLDGSGFTVLLNCDESTGTVPYAGLVQGPDGTLYGVADTGGTGGAGTVFKLNPDGSGFAVLHNFEYYAPYYPIPNTTGAGPRGGLMLGTDGALYGTTTRGGSGGFGTVFRLSFGPPPAPDLEVLALTTKNNKAPQGQKVTLTAVVKNTGTAAAGASTTVIKDGSTVLASVATPALGIGDSVTLTFDMRTATQNGIHILSATADAYDVVPESNESNNTRTLTVNIRGNQVR